MLFGILEQYFKEMMALYVFLWNNYLYLFSGFSS